MFKIEDGVPLTPQTHPKAKNPGITKVIAAMTVGQSFVMDCNDRNRSVVFGVAKQMRRKVACRQLVDDKSKMRVFLVAEAA